MPSRYLQILYGLELTFLVDTLHDMVYLVPTTARAISWSMADIVVIKDDCDVASSFHESRGWTLDYLVGIDGLRKWVGG